MPEFQYDPSTGSSHQVSRSGTQSGEQPNTPTIEEVEQRQLNTSVKNLSSRARNDNGAFPGETVNLQAEQQLLELQAELSRETNQIKIEQLLAQVETLAGQLVGEAPEPIQKENAPTPQEAKDEWFQDYKNHNPEIEDALAYAGEVMGSDLAGDINDLIDSDDEEVRVNALRTVEQLHKNPEQFVARTESSGIGAQLTNEIAEEYGAELADQISVLSNGVARGVISSSQAIATASKSPQLMQTLMTLAAQGRIQIAL